jgi:hypothetical protein
MSTFWVTRDRYDNPLSYSIWSVEPTRDRDGHWARLDPKRTSTDVRQICSTKVGEAVVGRSLALGEKIGPILGVYSSRQEPTTQTTQKTQ